MNRRNRRPTDASNPAQIGRRTFLLSSPVAAALLLSACGESDAAGDNASSSSVPSEPSATYEITAADTDLTGTADATAALQTIIDQEPKGSEIVIPAGAVLRCTAGIVLPDGKHLSGPGELRFTDGIAHAAAITVTGSGSRIQRLRMTNPGLLGSQSQTGDNPYAINIKAHNVEVSDCLIDSFQSGIAVDPYGEWYDTRILNNRVLNVLGAGDGPDDQTSTLGEDRGDGIVTWGAAATIIGNEVACRAGSDARIGIHCEALADREQDSGSSPNSHYTVADNTVRGQFRRGIAVEDITHATIVNNTVSDSTWWGIGVSRCNDVRVSGNTITYSRAANQLQGQSYSPRRAPVMVYGSTQNSAIMDNTISVTGDADAFIAFSGVAMDDQAIGCQAIRNECASTDSGITRLGVEVVYGQDCRIDGNELNRFISNGIVFWHSTRPSARTNSVRRTAGREQVGILFENEGGTVATDTTTVGNVVTGFANGILDTGATAGDINHVENSITSCTTGINLFGREGSSGSLRGNRFTDVATETVDVPQDVSVT